MNIAKTDRQTDRYETERERVKIQREEGAIKKLEMELDRTKQQQEWKAERGRNVNGQMRRRVSHYERQLMWMLWYGKNNRDAAPVV